MSLWVKNLSSSGLVCMPIDCLLLKFFNKGKRKSLNKECWDSLKIKCQKGMQVHNKISCNWWNGTFKAVWHSRYFSTSDHSSYLC